MSKYDIEIETKIEKLVKKFAAKSHILHSKIYFEKKFGENNFKIAFQLCFH